MVDKKVVEYVGNLAKIAINEEEKLAFSEQLSKIIAYIDKLKELDTANVEPMREVNQLEDAVRQDEAFLSKDSEDILSNAPSREGDFFRIPKVID
tara:strand:- start:525 stop:809 length:285 start_codon:yes stop_codon:yes gene_type:complete